MKITLKNVETFRGRDGHGLNADVYVDGVKTCFAHDAGAGGCFHFTTYDPEKMKELEAYVKTLPPIHFPAGDGMEAFDVPADLDHVVNTAFAEIEKAKIIKRQEKQMRNHILLGVPGANIYATVKLKAGVHLYPKETLQKLVNDIKTRHLKPGEQILNTNLTALGITI